MVRDLEFLLLWNPAFLTTLESLQVRGLLKHECYHLIFKHCTSRKRDPHILWNWATDLAINSLIAKKELPEGALRPGEPLDLSKIEDPIQLEKWKKVSDLIESLPLNQASEWYMEKLIKDDEIGETIEGDGNPVFGDDHDGWGNLSDEEKQIAEGKIKQALEEAVKRCDRTGQWGSVASDTRERLRKMMSDAVDWKRVLQNFCGTSQRANKSRTHKKINRKYPYIHPGVKRAHTASVAIYIDQSGSVGNKELEMFFAALNSLGRLVSFTVFPFDCTVDVDNAIKWRRNQRIAPVRTRSGGTSFHAVEEHVKEKGGEFDGHIILTDGEAGDPGTSVKRRCWVILPGCKLLFNPSPRDVVVQMS
jgi:predicted metal-dependent peptidase